MVEELGVVLSRNHDMVKRCISAEDPNYNHIGIGEWDRMHLLVTRQVFTNRDDYPTPAGLVCLKKEAVRQAVERIEKSKAN